MVNKAIPDLVLPSVKRVRPPADKKKRKDQNVIDYPLEYGWLHGWKGIAAHFGISQSLAQEWHKNYGLPIYYNPSKRVQAIVAELDMWMIEFDRLYRRKKVNDAAKKERKKNKQKLLAWSELKRRRRDWARNNPELYAEWKRKKEAAAAADGSDVTAADDSPPPAAASSQPGQNTPESDQE
jgi:hypothetical protein